MFNRLGNFRSYSISENRNLVGLYYAFCWQLDISAYFMNLLYKNKYLYDNIKNMNNLGYG